MTLTAKPGDSRVSQHRSYRIGLLFIFAAAVLWSLNGWLIKLINDNGRGPSGLAIAFYRSLFAGLCLVPFARGRFATLLRTNSTSPSLQGNRAPQIGSKDENRNSPGRRSLLRNLFRVRPAIFAGVATFAVMTACFVIANTMTAAANAIILQYTSTFWVFTLSPWLLGERASLKELPVLLLALAGVVVIFLGSAGTDLAGLMVALSAGLSYGLLTMTLRKLRSSDAAAVTVVNNLGAALLIFPFLAAGGTLTLSLLSLTLLVLMGAFQLGLPYYFFSLGLTRVPAHKAAIITLAEPLLVPVWTYVALGELVPRATLIGGGIILFALAIFIRFGQGRKLAKGASIGDFRSP